MDADALIARIATRHGVAVGRDDPVMILNTLNESLHEDTARKQEELLARFKSEMEAASEKWMNDAKLRAQAVLNLAVEASREAVAKSAENEFEKIAAATRQELTRLQASEHQMKWMLAVNVVASLLTFAAACLLFVACRYGG